MNLIEWRDDFSIGVPAVDHEHQELIEMINRLLLQITGNGTRDQSLDDLGEIYTMISSHFALEEKIMRDQHYGEYWKHKTDHDRLLDGIRDLMDEFEDDVDIDLEAFADRLSYWFTDHFISMDARLHRFLEK